MTVEMEPGGSASFEISANRCCIAITRAEVEPGCSVLFEVTKGIEVYSFACYLITGGES
jgi:hypothetical protein